MKKILQTHSIVVSGAPVLKKIKISKKIKKTCDNIAIILIYPSSKMVMQLNGSDSNKKKAHQICGGGVQF